MSYFQRKSAYELLIGDWSSVVCSSDRHELHGGIARPGQVVGDDGDESSHAQTLASGAGSSSPMAMATSSAGFSSPARFRKYEASNGARIELISTQAATCAVAVPTHCGSDGSAAAPTAGVAKAVPAVGHAAKQRRWEEQLSDTPTIS